MFSDGGPDVRWVGNESGLAGKTCWATINPGASSLPGLADPAILNCGQRPGTIWRPAEVDVSIRPGWFYHAKEDAKVKTPKELLKIYFESVGRGCNLLLNIPPDRRGQLHPNDVRALLAWRNLLETTFADNVAHGAKASASNFRGIEEGGYMLAGGDTSNTYVSLGSNRYSPAKRCRPKGGPILDDRRRRHPGRLDP